MKLLHNSAMIEQTYTECDSTIIYSEMYTVHCRTLISDLFTFQFLWLFEVCHYLQIRLIHTQLDLQPSKDFEGKYHKISNNLRVGYLSLRFWILDGQQIHSSLLYKSWLVLKKQKNLKTQHQGNIFQVSTIYCFIYFCQESEL